MIICPSNINNDTSNFLFTSGLLSKNMSFSELNQQRAFLFYYICIPFRILLYTSLLLLRNYDYKIINNIIQIICIITIIHLQFKKSKQCQWWYNELEQIIAFIIFIIAEISSNKKTNCIPYIVPVMLFDVFIGLFQSYIQNPFSREKF